MKREETCPLVPELGQPDIDSSDYFYFCRDFVRSGPDMEKFKIILG
jgi:hypothetical protein